MRSFITFSLSLLSFVAVSLSTHAYAQVAQRASVDLYPKWSEYMTTTLPDYPSLLAEQSDLLSHQCSRGFSRIVGLGKLQSFPLMLDELIEIREFETSYLVPVSPSGDCEVSDEFKFKQLSYSDPQTGAVSTCLEVQNVLKGKGLPALVQSDLATSAQTDACEQAHTNFYVCCDE